MSFYRYDDAFKEKEKLAKIEKRKRDRVIIKRAMENDAKQKLANDKLLKDFENTLTCNNCDLSILKDYRFDCSWCEANGSNFSKKNKMWLQYTFKWADLSASNFSNTTIRETSFYKANLKGADFSGARIGQANFAYANLENANFRNAVIGESLFNGANLKNADFAGAKIVRADFSFSDLDEDMFKSASLEDVKLKAAGLDKQLVGVWHMYANNAYKDVYYYEFFDDGSYIFAKGEVEQLHETDPRHRAFKEQHFYSIRKDAFEKMTPNSIFKDSDRHTKSIPKIQGDKLIFTSANTSETETFTRTSGKELVKYIQFRNRGFALRSAYLWNTDVIEKLSSNGVNYATLQDNYAANIFDHLFNSVMIYHSVGDDRNIRYIFKVLLRENEGFASGSGFERMLFLSMKLGYLETEKYLLAQSSSKIDMQYALIKYKKYYKNKTSKTTAGTVNIKVPESVDLVEKRISEL